MNLLPACTLPLLFSVVLLGEEKGGPLRFEDVTATHLPAINGASMDAAVVDVDDDGDLDIVVACEFCRNLLLINDGTGHFTEEGAARFPAAFRDSEDIGIGDFDADGDLDLVFVSEDDQVNELYLNDGTGFFTDASPRIVTTGISNAVEVADFNDDGFCDILIGNDGQDRMLINDGLGFFADETATRLPVDSSVTQDVELGDVDRDGDLDILVGNEGADRLLMNSGSGVFTRHPLFQSTIGETREADFGDVDCDGDLDILFANVNFNRNDDIRNRLLLNSGMMGIFTDVTVAQLPDDGTSSFEGDLLDLDGDGDLDIITGNALPALPSEVFWNDGQGFFVKAAEPLVPAGLTTSVFDVAAGDFNGDGTIDLYLAARFSPDQLLFGHQIQRAVPARAVR